MTAPINPHLIDTATPPIPEARGWITRYGGARGPLIDLSQAAPAVSPPPEMLQRLGAAASDPASARYGAIEGDAALREAYAADVRDIYAASNFGAGNIAITAGCNQAFMVTAMALAKAGDSIILPSPWYFNHKMALDMLGIEARPLICNAANGFIPDVHEAAKLIDERTRAIVLVTPNNPTGAIYPPETIAAFHELCRSRNIWLIVDETYRDFMPDGVDRPHNLFTREDWRDHLIQLYSFSKSYAIPGYRLGAILGAPTLVREIAKCLDTLQICPARVGQIVTAWAVDALRDWRADNRADINARAAAFADAMKSAQGWTIDSIGSYFAFLRYPFGDKASAARIAETMAMERGVLALPGSWFGPGGEGHLRVAFANAPIEMLSELPSRLDHLRIN
ncbi:aminotransferase [Terrarubrum flagellatum]|uniref:aminotransferase n=1 Tax=Terrirubrum flagellatum TaxID=2895980 RepID=UPI003144FC31